jgi:hypothetical protein
MPVLWRRAGTPIPRRPDYFQRFRFLCDGFTPERFRRRFETSGNQIRRGRLFLRVRRGQLLRQERHGGLSVHPALAIIGGGAAAAVLAAGVGVVCAVRNGVLVYAKVRILASRPIFRQMRDFSAIGASFQARGEEVTALLTRAFIALERISQALTLLRELVTRASRVRNPGN